MGKIGVNDKATRELMARFVGHYCYGVYPAPAITCEMNGGMIRVEGKAERLGRASYTRQLGIVIEGTVFHPSEIRCPSLHWIGEAYEARTK